METLIGPVCLVAGIFAITASCKMMSYIADKRAIEGIDPYKARMARELRVKAESYTQQVDRSMKFLVEAEQRLGDRARRINGKIDELERLLEEDVGKLGFLLATVHESIKDRVR